MDKTFILFAAKIGVFCGLAKHISIIFSTFTLVTTRRAPRHEFHASRMAEMPCQMQGSNGFDRPFNMPNQRGNNFNRPERFPSNDKNDWDDKGSKKNKFKKNDNSTNNQNKDNGPKTAPEVAPPSSTQNPTPNF